MPKLLLPESFKKSTGGLLEFCSEDLILKHFLKNIHEQNGEILSSIFDDQGNINNFVAIFVDGEDYRFLNGLETPLEPSTEVSVFTALAGG
jgi:molybdopterin synthase sulfur carrier subunit